MRPEGVVLPAAVIGQALGLSHHGEELGVEELISDMAVEWLSKGVMPRGTGLDVSGCGSSALKPASQGVGDKFGTIVAGDECRR